MSFRTAYKNTRSENGWRMCNRDECDLVRIPDLFLVDTAPLRRGAPLTILGAFLKYYDTHVDEISSAVWGWSNTNDVGDSNHLSGTAVDINAPKYPWGSRTMPRDRIAKVRAALAAFEGSVFWGADWNRADEMHFQLAWPEGDPRNEAFAAKLRGGYLGIYGKDTSQVPNKGGNVLDQAITNFKKISVTLRDLLWWMDKNTSDSRDQLLGPAGQDGKLTGWKILGRSKVDPSRDNTLVEAVAEIRDEVLQLKEKVRNIELRK